MARLTWLQLTNRVLRRLREPEVSSIVGTYPVLVGELVNAAKRAVEDAWNWTELRTELAITTASGTATYSLTGFGERYRIHQLWNDTGNCQVIPASHGYIERRKNVENSLTGLPGYWRLSGVDASGDPVIELYPTPTETETINVYATVAQADLNSEQDQLSVPAWPVILKAYALAVSERGEHGGQTFDETMREYTAALNDAVAADSQNDAAGWGSDWRVE